MNDLRSILKGTFAYEHGFFVDHEQITIFKDRNICYFDIVDFYTNTSEHETIDRQECSVCYERTFEPMYGYGGRYIHHRCYDIIKNILNNKPLFDVKLVFCGDFSIDLKITVYGILSDRFIVSDGHSITSWSIGYGRPCNYQDFHFMLGNFKPYKKSRIGECEMCFEEGECDDYCQGCDQFMNTIRKNMLTKYMLFGNMMMKDINIMIIQKLVEIYESILY